MKASDLFLFTALYLAFPTYQFAQPTIGNYNVYYGGLHNHTDVSDGVGTPAQAYNQAKIANLDFFGLSDHSGSIDNTEWAATKTAADSFYEPGVFTTFRGFEWTTFVYGHVNVINSENYFDSFTFTELCDWINNQECIAFFCHPGLTDGEGTEFNHFLTTPSSKIVGMELANGFKDYSVYYYNDGYFPNDGNKGYYDEALSRNWKIGAVSSEDNHLGTWGTATDYRMAILANANTREDLYDALKARRFYSTLDKNIALSFTINGNEMGSTVVAGTYPVRILASDGNGELFTHVYLVKNGVIVNTWMPNLAKPDIITTQQFLDNEYYFVKVRQPDGNEAISSPIWISGVNQLPVIAFTSPLSGATFTAPASVTLTATATDPDGTIAKVDFYHGSALLVSDNIYPYSFTGTGVPTGTYTLTAKATDNAGATVTSVPVTINVIQSSNLPPVIAFLSPAPGTTFTAPASITLTASASDPDGSIAKVDFYYGSILLRSDNSAPYSYTQTLVPAGNYILTARATDNKGASATSSGINLVVNSLKSANLDDLLKNGWLDNLVFESYRGGEKLVCYPVPFTTHLYIDLIQGDGESITGIELYDSSGKCIRNQISNNSRIVMDMSNLNPGIYMLRVRSNKGAYTKTVIKN